MEVTTMKSKIFSFGNFDSKNIREWLLKEAAESGYPDDWFITMIGAVDQMLDDWQNKKLPWQEKAKHDAK
jgi:hypothetical protein